jgi:polysaccharide export outer membrane protein
MKKKHVHGRMWKAAAVRVCCLLVLMLAEWAVLGTTLEAAESPVKTAADDPGVYRLMPGDKLGVLVFDQKDLSGDFVVDGAGEIMLPLAGAVKVGGLTLEEAQELIEKTLSEGILVHPTVSVKIAEFRPIFVTGYVRKSGNYPFISGMSVKAAIATAGGEGNPNSGEYRSSALAEADAIMADEHVRQLETDRLALILRKARLECQRDEKATNFMMPQLVGFDGGSIKFMSVYASENTTFESLVESYQSQLKVLRDQGPRIGAEIQAVNTQIDDTNQRLAIVSERLDEYQDYAARGYLRKELVVQMEIQKTSIQAELARLEAELAHLQQNMGDLQVRKQEVKANYKRQIVSDLQDASQRLLNIDATLGTARQLRRLRAQEIEFRAQEYAVQVTRTRPDNVTTTFSATEDTKLEPGDVVEIEPIQNEPESSTEAAIKQQDLRQEFVPVEQQPTLASYCSETVGEAPESKSNSQPGNSGDDVQASTPGNNSAAAEGPQTTPAPKRISDSDLLAVPLTPASADIEYNSQPGNSGDDVQASTPGNNSAAAEGPHATPAPKRMGNSDLVAVPFIPASAEIKKSPKATSKGAAVKAIQHALQDLGYSLNVDGVIGPITMSAIEEALANVKNQSAQRPANQLGGPNLLASGMR